ncbi:hypothetical protein ACH3VR_17660 [Microbacterium sp. B2969]|uniref:Uncharacterized protein n=1 Tax=Microbacterium alkaliflavum TaxID=3248839 RepID=A0ABW7QCM3_9MICO
MSAMVPNPTVRDDRAAEAAAAIARGWVRWYCGLVGTEAAERRRAEIESDLWEQRADARGSGRRSPIVAGSIAWRVVGGMPDDLLWVRTQRLAMRGQRADRKASAMNTLGHTLARWWWVAGAAMFAAIYLYFGIDNLVGAYAPLIEGAIQCVVYATLLVVGIALRVKAPRTSAVLITAGVAPSLGLWWAPILPVLAAVIVVGALIEVVRTSAPGVAPRLGGALGAFLLGVACALPGIGLPLLLAFGIAAVVAAVGIGLVVATRARDAHVPQAPVATA